MARLVVNIHDRQNIGDSTKLFYLKRSLTGEAAAATTGLERTNDNYKEAWEIINSNYNNERVITSRHYELLMAIPKMPNNNADSIRRLTSATQVHIRGMKGMGKHTDQWSTPLYFTTLSKLDGTTRREWNRTLKGTKLPTFDELMTFLREEATKMQTAPIRDPTASSGRPS